MKWTTFFHQSRKLGRRPYRPWAELLETRLVPANIDVLSYHYDQFLSGQNLQEQTLTPANVNATNFGTLLSQPIDGEAYAQPLYKTNLTIGGGTHNVAFIATEHDSVYAFDADSPTAGPGGNGLYWHDSFIDPAHGITTIPYAELSTPDLFPEIGITGSPVIDGSTNTLYVVVKTKEIRTDGGVHYVQKLHALDLATGTDKFGGPYQIGDTHVASAGATPVFANETTAIVVAGTGSESSGGANSLVPFSAEKENDRMALQLIGNIVYVAYASHADFRPYHGWVIGFNKTTLQPVKVFNTAPNADGVAIWESGGGLSYDGTYLYFAVGNGFGSNAFDPAHGNYSESVLKIDPTPDWTPANPQMMRVADYFTPFNWMQLDSQDADLGSGGVILLPDAVGSTTHRHLLVETGKQGHIYLIDRDNLGQFTSGGPDKVVQTVTAGQTGVWGNPSFFQINATTGIIYYHGSGDDLKGYYVTNGHIDDTPADILKSSFFSNFPGTQPTISADGISNPTAPVNGIVWELQVDNAIGRIQGQSDNTTAGPATLRAFSPTNLTTEFYDSAQTGQRDFFGGAVKFTVPVVTNGHVLVGTADHFSVLGLFPAETAVPAAPSNLMGQLQSTAQGPQIKLTWTNPAPNPGSDPTGIKIFRSTDGTNFTLYNTVNRNLNTFTDAGPFQFGQRYYYRVVATNQKGDSTASNTVNVLVPIPPSVLTVIGTGASSLTLTWTPVTNDHYDIERSRDGVTFTRVATVPGYQTSYTDTGLTPGQYVYRVHAFTATADSISNVQGAWVGPTFDHGASFANPTDLTFNGSAFTTTNLVELTNAVNQAGSAFSNTRITVGNFTTTFQVRLHEGTQPNYADGFTFVIQANAPTALGQGGAGIGYQGIGKSVAIKFSTFQHTGDPSSSSTGLVLNGANPSGGTDTTPSGLLLTSQNIKQITLTYDGTTLSERIEDILTHAVFTTSFTVNLAQVIGSDTAYVGFTGASGSGNFWELEDVLNWTFTSRATVPGAPTNLRQTGSTSSAVDLAWNSNSFDETGYQVERSTNGTNFTVLGTTTAPTFEDVGLVNGTYFYRVKALGASGSSPYSNVFQASLPSPILTQHQDVGTSGDPSVTGNATFANNTYTLTGSGSDVWDTNDHFQFLYAPFVGDGEVSARVVTEGFADPSTKTGVMIRESLSANAKNAFALEFPQQGRNAPTFQWRPTTGAATQEDGPAANMSPPIWLRVVRAGNAFSGYYAHDNGDGTHGAWVLLGTETVIMAPNVFFGLAATSHKNGTTITATFDHVQVLPAAATTSHLDVTPALFAANPNVPFNVTVRALDPFNNVVAGYRGTVHFTSSDAMAGLPPDYTFTAADNGVHTFSVTLKTLGRQTVNVTDAANTVQGATALTVTNQAILASLVVSGFPAIVATGTAGSFTVTAKDAQGGILTAYRGTVHFTSSDSRAVLPADYTFNAGDNGVHMFSATLKTVGTQSLTVTDAAAAISGSQSGIQVVALPALTSVTRSAAVVDFGNPLTVGGALADAVPGQAHQVIVSWGDTSANTTLNLAASVFTFSTNHTYTQAGNFQIQVTLMTGGAVSDTVILPATAAAVPPPAGLVDWWTGDGNNPTTAPDIAGSNAGTLNGGVTYAAGKVGNAFSFDGNTNRGSYVNIPDAPSLNATTATWDFWVKTTQTGNYVGFVGKADAGTSLNGLIMQMDPTGLPRLEIKNQTQTTLLLGTTHLNDGQWHDFALTFQSGGPMVMYVDGQVQATGTAPVFTFNPNPLRFGTQLDTFWTPYNGLLDEVQIFNRILPAADIQAINNAGAAGQIKGVRVQTLHLAVGGFPASITAGTGGTFTVTVQNGAGQTVTDYRGTVHFTSSDANAMLPADYTFTAADNGVHMFSATLKTAGTQTLTATDTKDASIGGTQSGIVVNPAAASTVVVAGFPSPVTAGRSGRLAVTLKDAFGNIAAGYRGTIHFTSSDPQAILPSDYTFDASDNGTEVFDVTLLTAGTQSITVTDTMTASLTGMQAGVVVNAAAASALVVSGFPSPTTAGVVHPFTVMARDRFGNAATSYRGTVHLSTGDPLAVLPPDYTFVAADNGVHTFSVALATAGIQSITATDTGTPALTGTQGGIVVNPAATSTLRVTGFPSPTTAGALGAVLVAAVDAYGNVTPAYTGTVHLTSSDPQAALEADHTFTAADNGRYAFGATLFTAGTQSLTATDTVTGSITGTQAGIVVNAAAAVTLVASSFPSPTTAGDSAAVTVTLVDPYGNVAAGYTGTVSFYSSDPQADLPADYTFTAADQGSHTFTVTLKTAGTQTLGVFDVNNPALASEQDGIEVDPAAPSVLVVSGFPSPVTAGTPGQFTITVQDAYGNTVTDYSSTVAIFSSDPQADIPGNYTFTPDDQGSHTFNATLFTAGTQAIGALDVHSPHLAGEQGGIQVLPAEASSLQVSGFPSPIAAGTAGRFAVTALDPYGNVATDYTGTVGFYSSDDQANLPDNYTFTAADGGAHVFMATLNTAGTQSLGAFDVDTGIYGEQDGIDVLPAPGVPPASHGTNRELAQSLVALTTGRAAALSLVDGTRDSATPSTPTPAGKLSWLTMNTRNSGRTADVVFSREAQPGTEAGFRKTVDLVLADWDGSLIPASLVDDLVRNC